MDFLTAFPYVGILILVAVNAVLVYHQDIVIDPSEHKDLDQQ